MFTGCGTAIVTPFARDFTIDEEALRRLIRRQIEGGIDFLVPCGTTGESPTLSRAEHLRVVEITVEESHGKVPVLGGAGGYNGGYNDLEISVSKADRYLPARGVDLNNVANSRVRLRIERDIQKDLLKLLTPEQEATLVGLGYIE